MSDQQQRRRMTQWLRTTITLSALWAGSSYAETTSESRKVFRCQIDRQIVFSDRPCGSAVESTEVHLTANNTYRNSDSAPTPAKTSRAPNHSASRSIERLSNSIAAEQLREKQRCQRLSDQLDTIQAKMRAGYTAQQGERLRERRRQLEQQRRTERCR